MAVASGLRACTCVVGWVALAPAACVFDLPDVVPDGSATGTAAGTGTGTGGSPPCDERWQDCNGLPADGCETDTLTDGHHCGSCARDCLEGACLDGRCVPTELYRGTPGCVIAVDGSHVYAYDDQELAILIVPKAGGTVDSVPIDPATGGVWQLLVDEQHLYFSLGIGDEIYRLAKSGGTASVFQTSAPLPREMALDGTHLYWFNDGGTQAVRRAEKTVPGAQELVEDEADMYTGDSIAVDADRVYWTSSGTASIRSRARATLQDPQTLVTNVTTWQGLFVDATHLYFAEEAAGGLVRAPKAGGAVETLASTGASLVAQFTIDDANAFVIQSTSLWRVPKTGGEITTLAAGLTLGCAVAVDESDPYAYFVDKQAGLVARVAK